MRMSATRIGLLVVLITACIGFLAGKLDQQSFGALAGTVVGYYYVHKTGKKDEPTQQ